MIVNDRWGKDTRHKHGGYFTTEYGAGMQDAAHPWEENRGMGYSYGYNRNETLGDYRTPQELILMFGDLVAAAATCCSTWARPATAASRW